MKKRFFFILTIIFFMALTSFSTFATGFDTERVSPNEAQRVKNIISFSRHNTKKVPFSNFDVNENGMVALVSTSGTINPTIYIYDQDGKFQYKYTVDADGSVYAEWEGDDLWIYTARGDYAILVNNEGKVLQVKSILNTKSNSAYWYDVWAKKKTIDDETYAAKTGLGPLGIMANEYAQIVVTRADGTTEVLYDVTSALLKKALLVTLFAVILISVFIFAIAMIVKGAIRYQNKERYGSPYAPNAKITFIDRILDALEKEQKNAKNDDEDEDDL